MSRRNRSEPTQSSAMIRRLKHRATLRRYSWPAMLFLFRNRIGKQETLAEAEELLTRAPPAPDG